MEKIDEALSVTAANLVLPIIKDLVMPKVQKVLTSKRSKFNPDETSTLLHNYMKSKLVDYSIIDTIAFSNMQTLFDVLYEPLTIVGNSIDKEEESFCIDAFPEEMFNNYFRIIVEDTGGMGKSTILKKIFKLTIEHKNFIPVLIYLSKINDSNSIVSEIIKQISGDSEVDVSKDIKKLLKDGDFIIMFDGFDEVSNNNKKYVISDLHNFIGIYSSNYYVMSTRPEDSIASFGDFKKFNVKPLTREQAFNIIERYDYYSFKKISDLLVEKISDAGNEDLKEYLKNPFLVSLLYKSFDYAKDIPLKKTHFYSQVYNALFEQHDLSKETYLRRDKYSKLHLDEFERVLRWLGFMTLKDNSVEYEKDVLIKKLNDIKAFNSDMNFSSTDYLKDLIETVPLFRKEGEYIRWAHKSLQGYFASKFIWIDSKVKQKDILRKMYDEKDNVKYVPILELFYELDQYAFESHILLWFLNDFVNYVKSVLEKVDKIDDDITCIISSMFGSSCYVRRVGTRFQLDKKGSRGNRNAGGKTVAMLKRFNIDETSNMYKALIVDYDAIKSTFVVDYKDDSNFLAILDLIIWKYPDLENDKKRIPESIDKLLSLELNKEYYATFDENSIFFSVEFRKQLADLVNSDFVLSYEKCLLKVEEINNRINRESVFDW